MDCNFFFYFTKNCSYAVGSYFFVSFVSSLAQRNSAKGFGSFAWQRKEKNKLSQSWEYHMRTIVSILLPSNESKDPFGGRFSVLCVLFCLRRLGLHSKLS